MRFPTYLAMVSALLLLARSAPAQSALASTAVEESASDVSSFALPGGPQASGLRPKNLPLLRFGSTAVRPHFSLRYLHSDGLLARPGEPRSTYVTRAASGVLLELGDDWSVDYTPTFVDYSNPRFEGTLDHHVSVRGQMDGSHGRAVFTSVFSSSSDPMVETARQTGAKISTTQLSGLLQLGGPVSFQTSVRQALNFLDGEPDWHEWRATKALHYRFSSAVDLSIGAAAGYVLIYKSADMAFIGPYVELLWTPTEKLVLTTRTGVEERKLLGGRKTWLETPILSATLSYHPTDTTALLFQVDRQVSPSYVRRQTVDAQVQSVAFSQRLFKRLNFHVSASLRKADYLPSSGGRAVLRSDENRVVTYRLSTSFLQHGRLSGSFARNRNKSSAEGFAFVSNQVGVEIEYRF